VIPALFRIPPFVAVVLCVVWVLFGDATPRAKGLAALAVASGLWLHFAGGSRIGGLIGLLILVAVAVYLLLAMRELR
jgi:hypothetical protein